MIEHNFNQQSYHANLHHKHLVAAKNLSLSKFGTVEKAPFVQQCGSDLIPNLIIYVLLGHILWFSFPLRESNLTPTILWDFPVSQYVKKEK